MRARIAVALSAATLVLTMAAELRAQAGGPAPPRADALVAAALKTAQAQRKIVLIEFGASWCTWCRSFDAFVHAPGITPIVADNYVLVNLTVRERDDKKALENAGADEAMTNWGGEKAALPYYVFLNSAGIRIADSNAMPDGSNIGFPGTPQELQMFVALLDKTAPRMASTDRVKIVDYLNKVIRQ